MKTNRIKLIALLIVLSQITFSYSQEQFKSGGYGYFQPGVMIGNFANLQGDLVDNGLIGSDEDAPNFAATIGGGGFGLLKKRLVLSGYGFGNFYPGRGNNSTNVKMTSGGGTFSVGYALVNQNNILLYPTLGFGLMGTSMRIENIGNDPLHFGDNAIPVGTLSQFNMATPMMQIALGFNKLLSKVNGGWTVGAQVGYLVNLGKDDWRNAQTNNDVKGVNDTGYEGFFFTILIGGGGFSLNEAE